MQRDRLAAAHESARVGLEPKVVELIDEPGRDCHILTALAALFGKFLARLMTFGRAAGNTDASRF